MRKTVRTIALVLSLGILVLAGCKSATSDDAFRAHYTTTPPSGAVILPATPPPAPAETAQPPFASRPASHLPDY